MSHNSKGLDLLIYESRLAFAAVSKAKNSLFLAVPVIEAGTFRRQRWATLCPKLLSRCHRFYQIANGVFYALNFSFQSPFLDSKWTAHKLTHPRSQNKNPTSDYL